MTPKLILLCVHIVEAMFFIGISGCVFTVAFSWVSILKGIFLDED